MELGSPESKDGEIGVLVNPGSLQLISINYNEKAVKKPFMGNRLQAINIGIIQNRGFRPIFVDMSACYLTSAKTSKFDHRIQNFTGIERVGSLSSSGLE